MILKQQILLDSGDTHVVIIIPNWDIIDGHETAAMTYAHNMDEQSVVVEVRRVWPFKPRRWRAVLRAQVT